MTMRKSTGFTVIELMIVVAIVGIISAIALPLYNDYISTSREGALTTSMATMTVFQEDLRLRTGAYGAGTWDASAGTTTLLTNVGWEPRSDNGTVYVAALVGSTGYTVTATDTAGTIVCIAYPAKTAC